MVELFIFHINTDTIDEQDRFYFDHSIYKDTRVIPRKNYLIEEIEWEPTFDDEKLTSLLNRQVKSEYARLEQNPSIPYVKERMDVFYRDTIAFTNEELPETYAVVLTLEGRYYGHVYCWSTPTQNMTLMMGIRSRIDNPSLRGTSQEVRGIARYLLEGVRRFTVIKGNKSILIVRPFKVMEIISGALGFVQSYDITADTRNELNSVADIEIDETIDGYRSTDILAPYIDEEEYVSMLFLE